MTQELAPTIQVRVVVPLVNRLREKMEISKDVPATYIVDTVLRRYEVILNARLQKEKEA